MCYYSSAFSLLTQFSCWSLRNFHARRSIYLKDGCGATRSFHQPRRRTLSRICLSDLALAPASADDSLKWRPRLCSWEFVNFQYTTNNSLPYPWNPVGRIAISGISIWDNASVIKAITAQKSKNEALRLYSKFLWLKLKRFAKPSDTRLSLER